MTVPSPLRQFPVMLLIAAPLVLGGCESTKKAANPDSAAKSAGKLPAKPAAEATDLQSMLSALDKVQAPSATADTHAPDSTALAPSRSARPDRSRLARSTPAARSPEPSPASDAALALDTRAQRVQEVPQTNDPVVPQPPPPATIQPQLVASTHALAETPAHEPSPPPEPVIEAPITAPSPTTSTPEPPPPQTFVASTQAVASDTDLARHAPQVAGAPEPAPVAPVVAAKAQDEPAALEVAALALCQRVEGFGRYLPYPSNKFLAGKPALMIVYTELAGFTQHPSESADDTLFTTELAQRVELYLDADGSLQYSVPEQTIRESSRSKRRDFYLVQRLELPRTLSVGKYNLKVRVTDPTTGHQAERTHRIEIVADASAAVRGSRSAITPEVITPENARETDRAPSRRPR